MGTEVSHPIFARVWQLMRGAVERELGAYRGELLAGLEGRVLEVGAGDGRNFAHYPAEVTEIAALEPEASLRTAAAAAAAVASRAVTVADGVAEALPFPDDSFHAAVACLVLCSVSDPSRAIAELHRVIRPGGELRFFEHVRSERPAKARIQQAADRLGLWPLVAGGCHCARQTGAALTAGGFQIESRREIEAAPAWGLTNPMILGVARATAA